MQISRSTIVLESALRLLKPLVRLLLRNGVAYPAFSVALKRVFLEAAQDELETTGAVKTGSAVSLLSGVHRRDIRIMTRNNSKDATELAPALNMASQIVARWLTDRQFIGEDGAALALSRGEGPGTFDALVAGISSDIRPKAVLDELTRLGIVTEADGKICMVTNGFAPSLGFEEMVQLLQANVHDHLAAACANLHDNKNFLEQAIFVDELSEASARQLHVVAAQAWRQTFKTVMQEAQARFDHDAANCPVDQRVHRVRFGSYFYAAPNENP